MKSFITTVAAALIATAPAMANDFDWRAHDGETINILLNNTAWTQALQPHLGKFTEMTGITLRTEVFSEEQYRARLNTMLQAKSSDIDVFMTLPSREGALYTANGWYADLTAMISDDSKTSPDYDYEGISAGLRAGSAFDGKITSVPINVEGPLFYWRRDIFEKCGIDKPEYIEDLPEIAAKIKACDSDIYPWAARGMRGTVGYSLGGFIYNLGGDFQDADGKATLCLPGTIKGLQLYGELLRDFGPPGATNHTYIQVIDLLAQGRVAMANESSGDMINVLKRPERIEDIGITVLPKSRETGISKPIAINWGVSISEFSGRKDLSWYFLQWVTSPEMQTILANEGIAPPRAAVFEDESFAAWIGENRPRGEWAKAVIEIAETGSSQYQTPSLTRTPEARDILSIVVQEIMLDQNDAETAACAVTEQLQALQE